MGQAIILIYGENHHQVELLGQASLFRGGQQDGLSYKMQMTLSTDHLHCGNFLVDYSLKYIADHPAMNRTTCPNYID